MKISIEPFICSKNKYQLAADRQAFRRYKRLAPTIKSTYTQIKFKDYLGRQGFDSIAEFLKHLEGQERRCISNPYMSDTGRFHSEVESRYWYRLSRGQPISSMTTTFYVNDAIGIHTLFNFDFCFWEALSRLRTILSSAFTLSIDVRKLIFIEHRFARNLPANLLAENVKQLYDTQLEKLYANKSIESLHALSILFIVHKYRSGTSHSRRVEKYLYAQFLYLMVYRYNIELIDELFVYVFFLLEANTLYRSDGSIRELDVEQLLEDVSAIKEQVQFCQSPNKEIQAHTVSQEIFSYLDGNDSHPYFHAFAK